MPNTSNQHARYERAQARDIAPGDLIVFGAVGAFRVVSVQQAERRTIVMCVEGALEVDAHSEHVRIVRGPSDTDAPAPEPDDGVPCPRCSTPLVFALDEHTPDDVRSAHAECPECRWRSYSVRHMVMSNSKEYLVAKAQRLGASGYWVAPDGELCQPPGAPTWQGIAFTPEQARALGFVLVP